MPPHDAVAAAGSSYKVQCENKNERVLAEEKTVVCISDQLLLLLLLLLY
jgi:hypothetical protein